jgi:hypothetical protein
LVVPLSRFTPQAGGGSAFYIDMALFTHIKLKTYIVFLCFAFALEGVVLGQPILLYKNGGTDGKYVLSRNYQASDKSSVSEVIISDSFAVHPDASFCQVILSNAVVLRTKTIVVSSPSVTTNVVQDEMSAGVLTMRFPSGTRVLFHSSMTDLGHIQFAGASSTNTITYEGEAALRELKKMVLKPPDDFDPNAK